MDRLAVQRQAMMWVVLIAYTKLDTSLGLRLAKKKKSHILVHLEVVTEMWTRITET